jgi:hypothetical protein
MEEPLAGARLKKVAGMDVVTLPGPGTDAMMLKVQHADGSISVATPRGARTFSAEEVKVMFDTLLQASKASPPMTAPTTF